MESMERLKQFYRNKRVFVTGHTGFKGTWLCKILLSLGADVTGYALEPLSNPNLFEISGIRQHMQSITGDIRDYDFLQKAMDEAKPEIVFHLAAQPIVRESYQDPLYTYETNVMGTANILECMRKQNCVKSFLNVTTDKVYDNKEWDKPYTEDDVLDGYDPYSNSKSCSELVTHSYRRSFFSDRSVAISTARAGNVIGGGDFAKDRIIPDCVRAVQSDREIIIRNPHSIRPYQHVLDPLAAYLLIAKRQFEEIKYQGCYNVGPDDRDCVTTAHLADLFCEKWGGNAKWVNRHDGGPHEARFLKLDCNKLKDTMNWKPHWNIDAAVGKTVEWTKAYMEGSNVSDIMNKQIEEFFNGD